MGIRIYLTGRVTVEANEELAVDERRFRGKQGRLVFAYLVSERNRSVPRDELARLLWPDELAPSWELSLSALMSRLRRLLSSEGPKIAGVSLSSRASQYEMHLPAGTWVDLEWCLTAVDLAEGALRTGEPQRIIGPATVAVEIDPY